MDGCLQAAVLFVCVQPVFAAKIGRKNEMLLTVDSTAA